MSHDLYNPTDAHQALREAVRGWAEDNVAPQAHEYDEREAFNGELFKRVGQEMGLFGVTVPVEHGGAGMDAVAATIIHEELSRFDPAFTLSYLAPRGALRQQLLPHRRRRPTLPLPRQGPQR